MKLIVKPDLKMNLNGKPCLKKCAAFLLCAGLLLLGGCAELVEERPLEDLSDYTIEPKTGAPDQDAYVDQTEWMTLYFLSENGGRLVPVNREVTLSGGQSRAQAAFEALLAGPAEGEAGAFWPDETGARARSFELSDGVATVNLPARYRVLEPETLFAVRLAVATTLSELPEISYVNVLVGGREEGLDLGATLPVGTLSRVDDLDVTARYGRLNDQRQNETGFSCLTTLYFPAAGGEWLLPIVRSVVYAQAEPVDYLYTLLSELGKGTSHELAAGDVPAPLDYIEEMPEIVRPEDGANRAIEIRFSREIETALSDAGLNLGIYMAMLTDTLMGFVPGVEGLQVYIGGERLERLDGQQTPDGREILLEQGLAAREDFDGYAGAPGILYVGAGEAGGLMRMRRVLPQARQSEPRELLLSLMELSAQGYTALPAGLSQEDILAVCVEEEALTVNLSSAFGDALMALTAPQARVAVYAMVNTLTEGRDQQSVVFFFDGEQLDTLAGGLNLRGGLLRNPGMVVN